MKKMIQSLSILVLVCAFGVSASVAGIQMVTNCGQRSCCGNARYQVPHDQNRIASQQNSCCCSPVSNSPCNLQKAAFPENSPVISSSSQSSQTRVSLDLQQVSSQTFSCFSNATRLDGADNRHHPPTPPIYLVNLSLLF